MSETARRASTRRRIVVVAAVAALGGGLTGIGTATADEFAADGDGGTVEVRAAPAGAPGEQDGGTVVRADQPGYDARPAPAP